MRVRSPSISPLHWCALSFFNMATHADYIIDHLHVKVQHSRKSFCDLVKSLGTDMPKILVPLHE